MDTLHKDTKISANKQNINFINFLNEIETKTKRERPKITFYS